VRAYALHPVPPVGCEERSLRKRLYRIDAEGALGEGTVHEHEPLQGDPGDRLHTAVSPEVLTSQVPLVAEHVQSAVRPSLPPSLPPAPIERATI
jgi:hypothetical protein